MGVDIKLEQMSEPHSHRSPEEVQGTRRFGDALQMICRAKTDGERRRASVKPEQLPSMIASTSRRTTSTCVSNGSVWPLDHRAPKTTKATVIANGYRLAWRFHSRRAFGETRRKLQTPQMNRIDSQNKRRCSTRYQLGSGAISPLKLTVQRRQTPHSRCTEGTQVPQRVIDALREYLEDVDANGEDSSSRAAERRDDRRARTATGGIFF